MEQLDPLRLRARRHGPGRAVVDRSAGFWATWHDLDGLAHAWARRFEVAGLRGGERVAVAEPAGIRFAALLHACLRSRAAIVPIPVAATERVVERILADCRPRLLVRDGELDSLPDPPARGDPVDACVVYTSGTTGAPKGVRLTLANHAASARGCQAALGGVAGDRWLLVLGPHHVGGLAIFMRSVLANQPIVTLERFAEAPVLEALETDRPALVSLVPAMLDRLLAVGGAESLVRVKAILVGGAPAPAAQVRRWAGLGLSVCPSYGLSETCSQIAVVPPGRAFELAGAAGVVGPHAAVEIGAGGEIEVSGPCLSPGYVGPGLDRAFSGGRFRTGDLGRLDGGVLTVLGRADDTVITGGENVRPEEVEAVLLQHPAVREAAVAGRPDPLWGEVVVAWVAPRGVDVADLEAWCRDRLPGFKVPRRWRFVDELPRTAGKLARRELPDLDRPGSAHP